MADRTVYGLTNSENGWAMVDQGSCVWVTVPGTKVSLQIREGQPAKILGAFVADWNAYIEPVRDADSACWTATNSVASSNHLSGTACDVCWQSHPFRVANAGFNAAQLATMREMLDYYEDTVFWGNDWNSPKDAMHVQMNGDTYGSENAGRVQDFINRKIRADGFSTFRRGGTVTPPPPPPASNQVDVLTRATGVTTAKAQEILIGVVNGLRDSQCNNVNRIAMWLAQIGHESAGFNATEEYQSGDETQGRVIGLGNTQPGDGVRFKGRTWIQITGRSNYTQLSAWAFGKGIVPTPTYFVDDSVKLAEIQYAGLGPSWYWTVARPQINSLCDARDLVAVTKAINGGINGLEDSPDGSPGRRTRYNRALALGDQLLALATPTQGEDDLSAEAERKIGEMYDEWKKEKLGPSRSFVATDGQPVASPLGFIYNIDGNVWTQQLTWAYLFDVPLALEVVESVAQNGSYAGTWVQSNAFNAWLNEFGQAYCQGLVDFKKALVAKLVGTSAPQQNIVPQAAVVAADNSAALTNAYADNARLREENARLQAAVSTPPTSLPAVVEPTVPAMTSGDHAGKVIDSVEDWTQHILAMDTPQRAAFATSMKALDLPNGTQP